MTRWEFEAVTTRLAALLESVQGELDGISYIAGELPDLPAATIAIYNHLDRARKALQMVNRLLESSEEYLARAEGASK